MLSDDDMHAINTHIDTQFSKSISQASIAGSATGRQKVWSRSFIRDDFCPTIRSSFDEFVVLGDLGSSVALYDLAYLPSVEASLVHLSDEAINIVFVKGYEQASTCLSSIPVEELIARYFFSF